MKTRNTADQNGLDRALARLVRQDGHAGRDCVAEGELVAQAVVDLGDLG